MDSRDAAVKAARFDINRTKNAALSHVASPKSDGMERDDHDARQNDLLGLGQFARAGGRISERLTRGGQVQLDKDNILQDHAANYDLQKLSLEDDKPSSRLLPIPSTWDARLIENKRVTPSSHWQDVRLLTIKVRKSDWNDTLPFLRPGDNTIIYPKNYPCDAEKLIDLMGWHEFADKEVLWNSHSGRPKCPRNMYPPNHATLRDLLIHNLDITAVPNRTFLKQLQRHTKDEREKERLQELTQESNTQEFYDYTSRPRRTILEVLEDFPGVRIPMEYALEIFPVIRGRAFSIANHGEDHQEEKSSCRIIKILVALVEYKTIIRKPRQVGSSQNHKIVVLYMPTNIILKGLCSRYIKGLGADTKLIVGFKRSQSPPSGEAHSRRPLLAVATGTGIAPIMSLMQERDLWVETRNVPSLLFFGCRSKNADFHFKDELQRLSQVKVIPAFSRDPISREDELFLDSYTTQAQGLLKPDIETGAKPALIGPENTPWMRSFDYDRGKMYVQHLIRREAKRVCQVVQLAQDLEVNPIIMICGNAGRMPISVRQALEDALVIGGLVKDNAEAKTYLQKVGIWMETW